MKQNIKFLMPIVNIAVNTINYTFIGFILALLFVFIITYNSKGDTTMAFLFILPIVFIFALVGFIKGIFKNDEIYKNNEAIEFDKALKLNPNKEEAWYSKGDALSNTGKYDEAIECYNKTLKLNPNKEEAWYNKGAALSKTGKYDEAIECYDKALKLNPNNEEAWYNCACAYSIKGNIEKAIYNLTKAIDIDASFKEEASADKDFEKLRDDEAFKKLIS